MFGCRTSTIRTTLILSFFSIFIHANSQSTNTTKTITPGRYGHCSVTWKNELYVFGGWDNSTDDQGISTTPFFYSTTLPLNVNNDITWTFLDTENALNVGSAACAVTPQGYLLVLGGIVSLSSTNGKVSTQVYDLNQRVWIDWRKVMNSSYPGFGINPKAAFISDNLLLVYAGNTGVNEDQNGSLVQIIYFLNVTTMPWTWSEVRKNQTIDAPISQAIASAKGNAWFLGGYFSDNVGNILGFSQKIWISNQRTQWVSPDLTLPYGISDGAIGVNNDTLFMIGFSETQKYSPVNVFPLNIAKMRFETNISSTQLKSRYGASFVQFPGSDAVLVYGGCATMNLSICDAPLNSIVIFNMTTRTWTTNYNIVINSQSNNFTLPLIEGFDMNTENDENPSNKNDTNKKNGQDNKDDEVVGEPHRTIATWVVVFITCLVTLILCILAFTSIYFCRKRIKSPAWHLDSIIRPSRFSRFSWQRSNNQTTSSASNHGTRPNSSIFWAPSRPSNQFSSGGNVSLTGSTKIYKDSDSTRRNSQLLIVPSLQIDGEKQGPEESKVESSKSDNYTWADGELTSHRRATWDIII
ncbi:13670_t:CDS:2 [Ambispora leptoticha]|uniref:13670_t:CDS:1 n=1 Tax=Ambispora leptoticha TaxID=144679 RepID=A0A9N9BCI5_9GLOM|nr:13670_t:CDS:2 [Ambispora leptoticha]